MSEWQEVDEPKVWASGLLGNYNDLVSFGWKSNGDGISFLDAFQYLWQLAPLEISPKFLFFREDKKVPTKVSDAFTIFDGLMIVSPAFRDVLSQFNIGETQLFEVPIYADETGTASGLANHFVLNVHQPKKTVIPELSENIKQNIQTGETAPRPDAKWKPVYRTDIWAVNGAAIGDADLWHDPMVGRRFFLSDRLKQALDAAGLKTKALELKPARVFEKT